MMQFYGRFQQWLLALYNIFNVFTLSFPVNKEVSYEDLKALLEKGQNLFLVDVRSQGEVDRGRISGSVHIPGELLLFAFTGRYQPYIWSWLVNFIYFPSRFPLIIHNQSLASECVVDVVCTWNTSLSCWIGIFALESGSSGYKYF